MTEPIAHDELFFAWEGAAQTDPWRHLRVVELHGEETISELYWFEIELWLPEGQPDVGVHELIGASAALKLFTRTNPAWRIIHGTVTSAVELGDVRRGSRYRVVLEPPWIRGSMARASFVHVDATPRAIVDRTMARSPLGLGLQQVLGGAAPVTSEDMDRYGPPRLTYEWRLLTEERIDDTEARPYCVQYFESDWAFVSRLLEEEGISYHFEQGDDECRVVLTDHDGGRVHLDPAEPLGPSRLGREMVRWDDGARLRPRAVFLNDYNWRKPQLDLHAVSRGGVTDFTTMDFPGRYERSRETGEILANVREERLDSERRYSTAEGRCRALAAGTIFRLEHPKEKLNGDYLVTALRHTARERGSFADEAGEREPYVQQLECLRCGGPGADGASHYRPPVVTPRPRIYGTQTAVVTAEPGARDAEINVGGAADIGCVRVKFHWDLAADARHETEPTSCFIRVSQFFAGSNHGALWHPRVGDEVIVEYLEGDPDRPIITGRVYNGTNLAPANATARPTYSAIQSLTSPYNGNYNLLSFEDLQGEEEIVMHAARDMRIDVERNYTRNTKAHDAENAGSQSISVGSTQTITVGTEQTITVGTDQTINVGGKQSTTAGTSITATAPIIRLDGGGLVHARGGAFFLANAGVMALVAAPSVKISGTSDIEIIAPSVTIRATKLTCSAALIEANGGTVNVNGGEVNVSAGSVSIDGGVVDVKGGAINLNC